MAGINRLGKGPPKPGQVRPQDPNKYRTLDLYSEGTEGDADYMRMVHDIEDTQASQVGWLFGRGAFDKGDLLYLRDEEERLRHAELELRDGEKYAFTTMRTRADAEPGGPQMGVARPAQKPRPQIKRKPQVTVKVKTKAPSGDLDEGGSAKRPKVEAGGAAGDAGESDGEEAGGGGLLGLLGDYGSESDEDERAQSPAAAPAEGAAGGTAAKHAQHNTAPAALPASASSGKAENLSDSSPSSDG